MVEQRRRDRARRVVGRGVRKVRSLRGGTPTPAPPSRPADEALLMGSPLFDHEWYARTLGRTMTREQAVRHFLRDGAERGLHPHPLFDPSYFLDEYDGDLEGRNPLCAYLRRKPWRTRTHPLLDTRGYLKRNPEAKKHPLGPLGHYDEVGAEAGLQATTWLPPDEDGRHPDLRAWVRARRDEWSERRRSVPRQWADTHRPRKEAEARQRYADATPTAGDGGPLVSVVLDAGLSAEHLLPTLRSLAAQTLGAWEALVVTGGAVADLDELLATELPERSEPSEPSGVAVRVLLSADERRSVGLDRAVDEATGEYVAFLAAGDTWEPDRLRLLVAAAREKDAAFLADDLVGSSSSRPTRYASHGHPEGGVATRTAVDLARVLVRRDLLREVGGFDTDLPGAWAFDLALRLERAAHLRTVPVLGVRRDFRARSSAHRLPPSRRPAADHAHVESWADVVLNRSLVDWSALAERRQDPGVVSVLIPTYDDWRMTLATVATVVASGEREQGPEVDCLVWDNGSDAATSVVLDSLPVRHPGVRVVHSPVNHGFALGNNLAVPHARGETIVFLNNDTTVPVDWLDPVTEALADPDVLGAQPLLVYPTGSVQSAGVVFPSTGGLPYAFLAGFPVEDARGIEELAFSALTGAALALRWPDVVATRGFDPLFTNGMEDVDLCQRLAATRPGHFRVLPQQPVVHFESRTAGRYARYMLNRLLYLDRWALVDEPRDDVRMWATRGLRVVDHQVTASAEWQQRRLLIPQPVLVREERLRVRESPPRLRWAIKNPAPAGPEAEKWGDTHFARAVASALRQRGQEVVIDHRPEFERATSRHDDVALVLHGLAPFRPTPEQVSIAWVISHPEMLGRPAAAAYDRVVAASVAWAAETSRAWGLSIEPLLQATDPDLFHPDRAVPDTGHPVLFVGSSRKEYRPIVRAAVEAGLPLSVYGDLWGRFVPPHHLKARYLPNTELGAAYRAAGVVLNDHWEDMRVQGFVSNRLFDAVGSGARVVTDDVAGLGDLFGDSVQVWRTTEDLVRLSSLADPDRVFGDDETRRAVAARVHREHSFLARAGRLVEIAVEERKRRGFDA